MRYNILLTALAFPLLSACGGGGGDSQDDTQPDTSMISAEQAQLSMDVLQTTDQLLRLAYASKTVMQVNRSAEGRELSGTNGGTVTYHFNAQANTDYQPDDSVTANYHECLADGMGSIIDGTLALTVRQKSDVTLSLIADASQLTFDGQASEHYEGSLDIVLGDGLTDSTIEIFSTELNLVSNDANRYTFNNLSIYRDRDLRTAKYAVNVSFDGYSQALDTNFKLATNTQFSGYLGEYPNEGRASLELADNTELAIESNFVESSLSYSLSKNDITMLINWSNSVSGFWSYNDHDIDPAISFRADNFKFLGIGYHGDLDNYSNLGEVDVIFSRPVESIDSTNAQAVSFYNSSRSAEQITANTYLFGGMVRLTPTVPFSSNADYKTSTFIATSYQGSSSESGSANFHTTANTAVIDATSHFFRTADFPHLKATGAFTQGQASQFLWIDRSNSGVAFSDEHAAETDISIADVADINHADIMLKVTSDLGEDTFTHVDLMKAPDQTTFLAYSSDQGEYIGQGQNVVLTPDNGNFTMATNYFDDDFNGQEHFSFNYNAGSDWWNIDVMPPQGEDIVVGKTYNAIRYPFQSPTVAGFEFSGSGRGCNNSSSEFTVTDYVRSDSAISSAAIDFVQYCDGGPALHGILRFNSTAPIN